MELPKICIGTTEAFVATSHHLRVLMPSLLIELVMINDLCPPFLAILVPGLGAFAALFLFLDFDPLQHFHSSHESNALINANSK